MCVSLLCVVVCVFVMCCVCVLCVCVCVPVGSVFRFFRLQAPSEREVCGVLQLILECRSTSAPTAYKFCMAAMTWVLRHSLHTREDAKAHVHACRDRFLESLMESFKLCKAKTEQARIRLLVDMHGDKLYLVFPKVDIDTAVAHLHDPATAHVHMGRLVAGSELGRAMFSEMVQSSLSSKCSAAIAAEVKKVKDKAVTKEVWDTHCRAAVAAAGAIDTHKLLRPRRVAILQYRGVQVHVKVKSFLEEAECLLSSMCKEVATKSGQLLPLVFEKDFVPDDSFFRVLPCICW